MATYYDGNGQILSAQTGISLERALDLSVRHMVLFDAMLFMWLIILLLSIRVPRVLCPIFLGIYLFGAILSCATWIPTTDTNLAVLLLYVHEHGQGVAAMTLFVTFVLFLWFCARLAYVLALHRLPK